MDAGQIIDIVFLAIVIISGLTGLAKGFCKSGLNSVFFILTIIALVFLSPIVARWLSGLAVFANLGESIVAPDMEIITQIFGEDGFGPFVVKAIIYVVTGILLIIVIAIVSAIIKKLLRSVLDKKTGLFGLVNKLLGFVYNVVFCAVILFIIIGAVSTIQIEPLQNALATSQVVALNPLNAFCVEHLNLGKLIQNLIPQG